MLPLFCLLNLQRYADASVYQAEICRNSLEILKVLTKIINFQLQNNFVDRATSVKRLNRHQFKITFDFNFADTKITPTSLKKENSSISTQITIS